MNTRSVVPRFSTWCRSILALRWILSSVVLVYAARPALAEEAKGPAAGVAPAIRLNAIGYLPRAEKRATVGGDGEEFLVRDVQTGNEVFRGPLAAVEPDESSGERLAIADFSGLCREGKYRLEIPGGGQSCEFRIADDLYRQAFYVGMRAMYLWRCGTEVSGEHGGQRFHHAACHLEDAYLDHAAGPAGQRNDGVGGWHDAGDYNKYTVNAAFTVGMMLQAWEQFPQRLAGVKLDIPESANDVPDFLDEVRWELDWLLKMQAGDGSAYHKLSTLNFGDFIPPEKESQRRYFSPWGSAATADLAAILAQAARVYRPIDEPFAERCLTAAEKSYDFLLKHPQDQRPDLSAFSTGPYQAPDQDDRLWAAAELWETTGADKYLRDFEQRLSSMTGEPENKKSVIDTDWDWGNLRNLGSFTYLLSQRPGRDAALVAHVRGDAINTADTIVAATRRHPYGRPFARYYWGCNGTVARQTMNLHVAHRLTGESRYRAAMLAALDHLFGRNPFGRSYVTGLGQQPPRFPHDRRSGADHVAAPWPGYLVGGPWPKPTDWYDDQEDYRTNEIAINWNGALIYALGAFVEPRAAGQSAASATLPAIVESRAEQ